MTDINPNQNAVTRYENPTPAQASADIAQLNRSLALVLAHPETTDEEALVVGQAIARRLVVLRGIAGMSDEAAASVYRTNEERLAQDQRDRARRLKRACKDDDGLTLMTEPTKWVEAPADPLKATEDAADEAEWAERKAELDFGQEDF